MQQIGEHNTVPATDDAPLRTAVPDAPLPGSAKSKSAKIHVVRARRQTILNHRNRQNARLQRLLLIGLFGLFYLVGVAVFYMHGLVDHVALTTSTILITSTVSFFYLCFLVGWNNRAREKNLRVPISLCAIGIMLLMSYMAPATQILFTPFLFLSLIHI